MAFNTTDQRKASFKHAFGKLHTGPGPISGEDLEASHQIYSAELLSDVGDIEYASVAPEFATSRTWDGTFATTAEIWDDGAFVSATGIGTDPNFEKITMPLTDMDGNGQTYVAFISASQANTGDVQAGEVAEYSDSRFKNWLNPTKFGPGYAAVVYENDTSTNGPSSNAIPYGGRTQTGKNFGGAAFDYYQGIMYCGDQSNGDGPDMSGYAKPLWIVGYRYIGATGAASSGGGGITAIDSTTETNLSFDADSSVITIGAQTAAIGVGSLSPYKRAYYNHDFARHDFRNSSSILINNDSDANGAPYTDGADNQLLIPVIHMPLGFGFSIGFTSSNFESSDLTGHHYFEHSIADKWDYHATETSSNYLNLQYTDGANGNIPFNVRAVNQILPDQQNTKVQRAWYAGDTNSRIEFDITNKTKFEIADGLRQLINTSKCYQHVSASVYPIDSDYRLQVEQVYAGYPYADHSIKYYGSSTGSNLQEIPAHTFVSDHFTGGSTQTQNLYYPENCHNSDGVLFLNSWSIFGMKSSYMGALGFGTTVDVGFDNTQSPGFGDIPFFVYDKSMNSKASICLNDVTASGLPYGKDTVLVNGELGQLNPTNRSILKFGEMVIQNDLWQAGSHHQGKFANDPNHTTTIETLKAMMHDNSGFTDFVYSSDIPFIQYADSVASQKQAHNWPMLDMYDLMTPTYLKDYYDDPVHTNSGTVSLISGSITSPSSSGFINLAGYLDLDNREPSGSHINTTYASHSVYGVKYVVSSSGDTVWFQNYPSQSNNATYDVYYPKKQFAGTYVKEDRNASRGLVTYYPLTYNYIDPDKFSLSSAGAIQTITSPLKLIGDFEIAGTLSASAYQGITGGSGAGFPYTGDAVITGSLEVTSTFSLGGFADVSASLSTAIAGADDLGDHTATQTLDMASNAITNVTTVSASGHISASNIIGHNSGDQDLTAYSTNAQLNASSSILQTNINTKATTNTNATFATITSTGNTSFGNATTDNHAIEGNLKSGPAIIGISGSEKQTYNDGKLETFFKGPGEAHYSLYVRNGATIVGGDVIPDRPEYHSLGSKRFPFRHIHVSTGSIIFYSASADDSGSDAVEHARMGIDNTSGDVQFISGSDYKKIRVKEVNMGAFGAASSVQIGTQTQGFVAVNATAGSRSTILRAESAVLSDPDEVMGSITQKGSGSFAILLDADDQKPAAKFVIESNSGAVGYGNRLFSVSESMETRVYGNLKVDTHITASGNVSASGTITATSYIGSLTDMDGTIDGGTF